MILTLSTMLRDAGYRVETAMNGQEALDRLEEGLRPALILTDVNMPVMDGLTFVRQARRRKATRFTPILVLTSEMQTETESRNAGASGWLAKPPRSETLLSAVGGLLPP